MMKAITTIAALALLGPAHDAAADTAPKDAAPKDLPACPTSEDAPDVKPLVQRLEQTLEGKSSVGTMKMTIKTSKWTRTLEMKVWSKGRDYALVRILDGGPREKGMMTLKREKQLWNYLPQAGRVMKIPSGMLGDAWMGSDFTNDDLVRGTSLVKDFDAKITGTLVQDKRKAWKVELVPRKSATVVWGKIEAIVDRASCVPLQETFYDEDGTVARTMSFSDLRTIGWRTFPAQMIVKPAESGRETSITYEAMEFDVEISDDTFSLARIQKGR